MFDKLKSFLTGLGYAWQYSDTIHSVITTWQKFPGWNDSELLRLWVRPVLTDATILTAVTKTPIDDVIAAAAIRIVDNNTSWAAVFALAQLVRDGQRAAAPHSVLPHHCENPLPLVANNGGNITPENIACDACPECPAVGLAALGILLFLLQQRRV